MYEPGAFCHRNNDANNAGISIFNITTWRYSSIAMCKSENWANPKEEQRVFSRLQKEKTKSYKTLCGLLGMRKGKKLTARHS